MTGAGRSASSLVVGVISDTHGLLRPEAVAALAGCAHVVHAGDVGEAVLPALRRVAPVTAVRGNTDRGAWCDDLRETEAVEIGGALILVLHDLARLDVEPAGAGIAAVVSGHTHVPRATVRRGVLYLNPGSAGPRRFALPVSVARLTVADGKVAAEIVRLDV